MKSIVNVPVGEVTLEEAARMIRAVTLAHIDCVVVDDEKMRFYLTHHSGPVCPHCGDKIHDYGHGLCLTCWRRKSGVPGIK